VAVFRKDSLFSLLEGPLRGFSKNHY